GHPACAVCLGRHNHAVAECNASNIHNQPNVPTVSFRNNKELILRKTGSALCYDWQRRSGCGSRSHNFKHICSGCGERNHGAQDCPRAEK
ncbi:hypothetical protein SISNIDRAFT_394494, partial [Sistotremastrum niveocremeum HHB9708]